MNRMLSSKIALIIILLAGAINSHAQVTYSYTGTVQTYVVPAGTFSITVDAQGAGGGDGNVSRGGYGGRVQCTLAVTPGDVLQIRVGGSGVDFTTSTAAAGGYNGGGASGSGAYGGGGGGASDIRIIGTGLSSRVIVAGGGGGGGFDAMTTDHERGGGGGNLTGENGYHANINTAAEGGAGGSASAGGAGGIFGTPGTAGALGNGGTGGTSTFGGGGGGGFYGGGGGSFSGGGGGSSYTSPTYTSAITHTQDYNSGDGVVILTPICTPPTAGTITGQDTVCTGSSISLTATGTTGGTWSSSNPAVAGVTGGMVTGYIAGTATISYTVTNSCGTSTTTTPMTVITGVTPISGTTTFCVGTSVTLTNSTTGGVWTSAGPAVATIGSATGVTTGLSVGDATISYILGTGCATTTTVHVTPGVVGGSIITPATICTGGVYGLGFTGTGGGTWSSSNPAVANMTGGFLNGVSAGTATITYSLTTSCGSTTTTTPVTVIPGMTPISGPTSVCVGSTITLTNPTSGGTWSSSSPGTGTVGSISGIVTGISGWGETNISYSTGTGCIASLTVAVNPIPTVTGSGTLCVGATTTLTSTGGGIWTSSAPGIATIGSTTGFVTGVAAGSVTMTYTIGTGCSGTAGMTIIALPPVTATSASNCGGDYTITAGGAGTYSWSPATGLLCSTCATTTATIPATTTYVVTGTLSGCSATANVTLNGNRITGHITYTGGVPTDTFKVWLIKFNPADSSLTGLDSTFSCLVGGTTPYYEFAGVSAGNYLVKAKLLSAVAGTSGYMPTYGLSTTHWDTAAPMVHTSSTDSMHINMVYGTVPAGPGFIGGYISSGAGKGTSGEVPAVDMIVYLMDGANNLLTYTYTDGLGNYSFPGLAYGSYIVHPSDYKYRTTPSALINLSSTTPSVSAINFKQRTTYGIIVPVGTLANIPVKTNELRVYPNPVAGDNIYIYWDNVSKGVATVTITDVAGRELYQSVMDINTGSNSKVNVPGITPGIYLISITTANGSYRSKLEIE